VAATLVSMKISAAEREKRDAASTMAADAPAYPYGLSLQLEDATLRKLDVKATDYKVGDTLALVAKVEVTSISSHESKGGWSNDSVGLQITDLCVEDEGANVSDAAKALYKGGGV